MNPEPFFDSSFLFVAPFWFLMMILPFWKWTERIIKSPLIILGPALMYIILIAPTIGDVFSAFNPLTLDNVSSLLSEPTGATLGWVHFLAFDLFVGRWVYLDSRTNNLFWPLVSLALFFVLMFGPLGFVSYLIIRTIVMLMRKKPLRELIVAS